MARAYRVSGWDQPEDARPRFLPTIGSVAGNTTVVVADKGDFEQYPDVKDPAVDLIYLAAEDWARVTGWKISPPDAADAA